jgi:hypothetical protein
MQTDYARIPHTTLAALEAWINHGRPTGSFLKAVLENDLAGAFMRADEANLAALRDIVFWVYHEAPIACWGSLENVTIWRNQFRAQHASVYKVAIEERA